jgi:hypothetical protein
VENLIKVDINVFKDDTNNTYRIQVIDENTGALTPLCEIPSLDKVVDILTQVGISGGEIGVATARWELIRNKMIDLDKIQRLLEPYHPKQ